VEFALTLIGVVHEETNKMEMMQINGFIDFS
jgi:hypothetical protein